MTVGAGGDAPKNWRAYKELKEATTTPICTGESLFGLEEGFRDLIENRAVDIIHPDPLTSGAVRRAKRIGDFAAMHRIQVALHFAGSPVGCMASVHMAAYAQGHSRHGEPRSGYPVQKYSRCKNLVTGEASPARK